jgi:hypothetical protein
MSVHKTGVTALLLGLLCHGNVNAQFSGLVNLPRNDFVWRWGDTEEVSGARRTEDFAASGVEASFRCDLKGRLSPSSRMTEVDVRQLENELQGSLYFIQAAAYAMNELDLARNLDWAELNCVKPQATERDPEETQEKVDRAREKAVQEMLERRERRERRESRDGE